MSVRVEEKKGDFLLTSAKLMIKVNKSPSKIDVFDLKGKVFTSGMERSIVKENRRE